MRTSNSIWKILHVLSLVFFDLFCFWVFSISFHIQFANLLHLIGDIESKIIILLFYYIAPTVPPDVSIQLYLFICQFLPSQNIPSMRAGAMSVLLSTTSQKLEMLPSTKLVLNICLRNNQVRVGTSRGKQQDRRAKPIDRSPKYRSCCLRGVTISQDCSLVLQTKN